MYRIWMMVPKRWIEDAHELGWVMPTAPWWKRLPIVRHIRFLIGAFRVSQHDSVYAHMGLIPTGYDNWVLCGIWHGMERKPQ